MSLQTTIKNYKKAQTAYEEIDDTWADFENSDEQASDFELNQVLQHLKELKKYLKYVDVSDLEGEYSDETIDNVKYNLELMNDAAFFWGRSFLGAKYSKDLKDAVKLKYFPGLKLSDDEINRWGGEKSLTNKFIGAITHPENIVEYERAIRRMALGTMSQSEFNKIFDVLKFKMIPIQKGTKRFGGRLPENKIPSLEEYTNMNEDFFNPFDDDDKVKEKKPSYISDKGGSLALRKETFNLARVEFSKRPGGEYTVIAKTQFARGEIIEICPTIIVGEEAKVIDKIKDIIFEIDKDKNEWALVLGYGSLYRHSDKPNVDYAYNKLTKQMYFITKNTIKQGEELTVNYGQDYWMERMTFNTMTDLKKSEDNNQGMPIVSGKIVTKPEVEAIKKPEVSTVKMPEVTPIEKQLEDLEESEIQPNKADIDTSMSIKDISSPKNPHNPVRSGVAIIGTGQS